MKKLFLLLVAFSFSALANTTPITDDAKIAPAFEAEKIHSSLTLAPTESFIVEDQLELVAGDVCVEACYTWF